MSSPGRKRLVTTRKEKCHYEPAEEKRAEDETHISGYKAIKDLEPDPDKSKEVLVLPTCNFPFADFALARYWFVNAKVGESTLFKCATALSFLQEVGVLQNENGAWKPCRGMEEIVVELDLIGVGNLDSKCVFERTGAELKIVGKYLLVTNVDVGTKAAGNTMFESIKKALMAYGLDEDATKSSN